MRTTSRILRFAATACLALYLGLVAGVPVLHAMEAAPMSRESHVHGDHDACAPQHDEVHCSTCSVAAKAKAPPPASCAPISTEVVAGPARTAADDAAPSRAAARPSLPRGPPALR